MRDRGNVNMRGLSRHWGSTCGCHVPWCGSVGCCSLHELVSHRVISGWPEPYVCVKWTLTDLVGHIAGHCRTNLATHDMECGTRVWDPFVTRIPCQHSWSSMMLCVRASFAGCMVVCLCAQCGRSALDSNASSVGCGGTVPQSGNCRTLPDRAEPCRTNFRDLKAWGAWPCVDLIGQQL